MSTPIGIGLGVVYAVGGAISIFSTKPKTLADAGQAVATRTMLSTIIYGVAVFIFLELEDSLTREAIYQAIKAGRTFTPTWINHAATTLISPQGIVIGLTVILAANIFLAMVQYGMNKFEQKKSV